MLPFRPQRKHKFVLISIINLFFLCLSMAAYFSRSLILILVKRVRVQCLRETFTVIAGTVGSQGGANTTCMLQSLGSKKVNIW